MKHFLFKNLFIDYLLTLVLLLCSTQIFVQTNTYEMEVVDVL